MSTSLKTKKHCLLIILFKYINKINNRVVFEIKGGYNIQLQIHETMKILGRTQKINKQNKEWWKSLEVVGVVLVQCNLVDKQYQEKLEVSNTFKCNKSHPYLLNVKQSNLVFLKTYNTEFDEIIITPTYQNGRPLEIEDKVNLKLLINK